MDTLKAWTCTFIPYIQALRDSNAMSDRLDPTMPNDMRTYEYDILFFIKCWSQNHTCSDDNVAREITNLDCELLQNTF